MHLLDWGGAARPPLLLLHGFTLHEDNPEAVLAALKEFLGD